MKRKTKYTHEPMEIEIIDDFLPSPDKLVLKKDTVKITIALGKNSVDFFKRYSKKYHHSYQQMIRRVIDSYAAHYDRSST